MSRAARRSYVNTDRETERKKSHPHGSFGSPSTPGYGQKNLKPTLSATMREAGQGVVQHSDDKDVDSLEIIKEKDFNAIYGRLLCAGP